MRDGEEVHFQTNGRFVNKASPLNNPTVEI